MPLSNPDQMQLNTHLRMAEELAAAVLAKGQRDPRLIALKRVHATEMAGAASDACKEPYPAVLSQALFNGLFTTLGESGPAVEQHEEPALAGVGGSEPTGPDPMDSESPSAL